MEEEELFRLADGIVEEGADVVGRESNRVRKFEEKQRRWEEKKANWKVRRKNKRREHVSRVQRLREEMSKEELDAWDAQHAIYREQRRQEVNAKREALERAIECGVRVVVDCSFDHFQSEKELASLAVQVCLSQSMNKRSYHPVALHCTSVNESFLERLVRMKGDRWKVGLHSEDVMEIFPPESLIVLSPDADEYLEEKELDPSKVYVLGGIVDRTVRSGETRTKALRNQLQMRKLPTHLAVHASGHVLTVDQAFQVLLSLNEGMDFATAITKAVPNRKTKEGLRARKWQRKKDAQALLSAGAEKEEGGQGGGEKGEQEEDGGSASGDPPG